MTAACTRNEWETIPLRYVCELYPSVSFDGLEEDDDVTFLPMDRVKNGYFIPNAEKFSKYMPSYNAFEEGDIILAKVTPCFENGNIAIAEHIVGAKGFGSSELFVIRPTVVERRFLFYYFQSSSFKQEGEASMTGAGGLKRVSPDVLRQHHLPFPSQDVQRLIANYLDRETARIDGLIAEKERMLALLEEKRAALISRVVTRGLDPTAPLKPSGLDWLGNIPAHWEVWRLKHVGDVISGSGFPHDFQGGADSEILFLKVSDMNNKGNEYRITGANNTVSREVASELSATIIPVGGVVYAKIGAALLLNKRRILGRPSCIDNNMSAFVPKLVSSEWAHAWLSQLDFGEFVNPGAIPSFTEGQQKELPILLPPQNEQIAICEGFERFDHSKNSLSNELRMSLQLLKERRAALITAAVTGQIPAEEMSP